MGGNLNIHTKLYCRINAHALKWRCIDVNNTLLQRRMPTRLQVRSSASPVFRGDFKS